MLGFLKSALPDRPTPMRVWRGPFRGARVVMNPRTSLRKVLGLYEHELNGWIDTALGRVTRVLDVGANDGYFTFGCAAGFHRRHRGGEILAFEAQAEHVDELKAGIARQQVDDVRIEVVHKFVDRRTGGDRVALDDLPIAHRSNTLIKIDVEGAEVDVLAGAQAWISTSNPFVIEVHREPFLAEITTMFAARGVTLRRIDQQALPFIGKDLRDPNNWWLVSDLGA
jgi:hypothetical protein